MALSSTLFGRRFFLPRRLKALARSDIMNLVIATQGKFLRMLPTAYQCPPEVTPLVHEVQCARPSFQARVRKSASVFAQWSSPSIILHVASCSAISSTRSG